MRGPYFIYVVGIVSMMETRYTRILRRTTARHNRVPKEPAVTKEQAQRAVIQATSLIDSEIHLDDLTCDFDSASDSAIIIVKNLIEFRLANPTQTINGWEFTSHSLYFEISGAIQRLIPASN